MVLVRWSRLAMCLFLLGIGCSDGGVPSGTGGAGGGKGGQGGSAGSSAGSGAGTSGGAGGFDAGGRAGGGMAGTTVITDAGRDARSDATGVTSDGGRDAPGDAAAGCYPACLATLTASCPSTGGCVAAADSSPSTSDLCFANGVTVQTVAYQKPNGPTTTNTVKASGGALCYTLEIDGAGASPIAYNYTWKDPSGAVVATAAVNPSAPTNVFITCGSMSYMVDTAATRCAGQELAPPAPSTCASGACSF